MGSTRTRMRLAAGPALHLDAALRSGPRAGPLADSDTMAGPGGLLLLLLTSRKQQ